MPEVLSRPRNTRTRESRRGAARSTAPLRSLTPQICRPAVRAADTPAIGCIESESVSALAYLGVQFVSLRDNLDLTTPQNVLLERILVNLPRSRSAEYTPIR
jgi:hypothetical protein